MTSIVSASTSVLAVVRPVAGRTLPPNPDAPIIPACT
eukprot:CAMPEP_0198684376 /NCGR_PEP_ID=MMETSP1468-20131203/12131_1 /TAXON_ID=1461545 /ORGANISM="Mantoniella sp, Strain CCMP1436" /LENGTH=36 /DNA_ID= /DNA_START= /DNA_END= /DNA_ORIENTATION=